MKLAWGFIHSRMYDESTLETIRQLFPRTEEEQTEDHSIPELHKTILGYSSSSLEEVILGGVDLNEPDSRGCASLVWAVRRQDHVAVKLLLEAGADPNVSTPRGSSPLHFAAVEGDLACVRMLLNAGAKAKHQDGRGVNALLYAAQNSNNLEVLKILIAAGINILSKDLHGVKAIQRAINGRTGSSVQTTKLLSGQGADINAQDLEGDTPLLESLYRFNNAATEVLLQRGADCTIVNGKGDTILHVVAGYGNLETLAVLRAANIANIDPYAVNHNKKTAFEIAQQRDPRPDGFIDLFLVLLFEIRNRNDYLKRQQSGVSGAVIGEVNEDDEGGSSSEAEEFHDAVEQ